MAENTFEFQGASGVPFTARMVTLGQGYGLWDGQKWALNHGVDKPMVEFYDRRALGSPHASPHGQFISRYFLETLKESLEERGSNGLLLDTGSPQWNITRPELWSTLRALESVPRQRAQEICKDFEYECIARGDEKTHAEIWRCKEPGSFEYAHDVMVTKMGITVVGDMDPLVFRVTGRGMDFLAGNDVEHYIYSKLDESSRDQVLDMSAVYAMVAHAVSDHLALIWVDTWEGDEKDSPMNTEIGPLVTDLREAPSKGDKDASKKALDALLTILAEKAPEPSESWPPEGRMARRSAVRERLGALLDDLQDVRTIDQLPNALSSADGIFGDPDLEDLTCPSESVLTRLHVLNIGAKRIMEIQREMDAPEPERQVERARG